MFPVACSIAEKITVQSNPTTVGGKPAAFDGPIRVSVVSGDGTAEQDPASPLTFKAVTGAAPGVTVFLVEADVDRGAGVILIQETVELTATDENAAAFGMSAGPIEAK